MSLQQESCLPVCHCSRSHVIAAGVMSTCVSLFPEDRPPHYVQSDVTGSASPDPPPAAQGGGEGGRGAPPPPSDSYRSPPVPYPPPVSYFTLTTPTPTPTNRLPSLYAMLPPPPYTK
ncbi:hypothetical protein ACOMHN_016048 [Nucella lapillus]